MRVDATASLVLGVSVGLAAGVAGYAFVDAKGASSRREEEGGG